MEGRGEEKGERAGKAKAPSIARSVGNHTHDEKKKKYSMRRLYIIRFCLFFLLLVTSLNFFVLCSRGARV